MTRDQAFQHLGVPAAAEAAAIGQKYADLKAGLAAAHAAAPTPGLKAKHQQAMNQVDEAFRMAMSPAPNHPLTAPHAPEPPPVADPRVEEIIRQNAVLMEELRKFRQAAAQPAAPVVSAVPLPKKHAAAAPEDAPAPARETRPIPLRLILICAAGLAVLAAGGLAWKGMADKATADKATADKATADKATADKARADKARADKARADKARADKATAADMADRRVNPARATVDAPFINSHGMKFVPVTITGGGPTDGHQVFFSIWETREQDYAAFATATKRSWSNEKAGDTHPAVNISWEDATAYCEWVTKTEQAAGRLTPGWAYRLPTDHEWSCAVGLKEKAEGSPSDKDGVITDGYPWGKVWPPPKNAGNYYRSLSVDTFESTAPVGSFPGNKAGIFDLGGNVWEWVASDYAGEDMLGKDKTLTDYRALRGGSWNNDVPAYLLSSNRNNGIPGYRSIYIGFRVVVVSGSDG